MARCSIRLLLAVGLAVVAGMSPPSIARAVTVSVSPPDTTVLAGDEFMVRVVTDEFADLKAFQLIFDFDPTILELQGIEDGDVLTGSGRPYVAFTVPDAEAPVDSAHYDAAMLDRSTAGPGVLAYFRFKALRTGTSVIGCQKVDFRDSNNVSTVPLCESGSILVTAPTATRRTTWGTLKSIYR